MIKTEPDKIRDMLQGCKIVVPDYQRAYSWEKEHLETFRADMEDFIGSRNGYYLGHLVSYSQSFYQTQAYLKRLSQLLRI